MPGFGYLLGNVDAHVIPGRQESRNHDSRAVDLPENLGHAGRTDVREGHPDVHIGQPETNLSREIRNDLTAQRIASAMCHKDKSHGCVANR
jgi:hypothetical protein